MAEVLPSSHSVRVGIFRRFVHFSFGFNDNHINSSSDPKVKSIDQKKDVLIKCLIKKIKCYINRSNIKSTYQNLIKRSTYEKLDQQINRSKVRSTHQNLEKHVKIQFKWSKVW